MRWGEGLLSAAAAKQFDQDQGWAYYKTEKPDWILSLFLNWKTLLQVCCGVFEEFCLFKWQSATIFPLLKASIGDRKKRKLQLMEELNWEDPDDKEIKLWSVTFDDRYQTNQARRDLPFLRWGGDNIPVCRHWNTHILASSSKKIAKIIPQRK
jgi:hypothetical protein